MNGATGTQTIRSDRAGDTITIHFRGNEFHYRRGARSPHGGRLSVTVDGSADDVRDLPKDDRGRRYLDFGGASEGPVSR